MSPSPVFPDQDPDYAFAMDAIPTATATARINKFDGTNFHTWKFKMQMVLEERELWEVTSGEVKLEHCQTAADQALFRKKSRKALAIVCLAMEDSQLPLVRSAKDAHDAWSRLKGHFEKKSLANKLFLRRRFFTTMMDEGDGVLEHINKIKTLAEQLDAVGAPVSEDDLVITLLGSLSESYQFLITALESRADSLTWELVTSRLLHEDMKRKEQGGGVDGAAHGQGQAFMTSGNSKYKGRQAQKTSSACHYCGEHGHWIAKCPVRIRENAERQRPQRANVAQSEDDSGDFLFSVGSNKDVSKSSGMWLVDSGATQHMTYSKEYMKNFKKITPVDVHLADDGVVQALGTGDIVMSMRTPRGMKKGVLTNVWYIPKLSRNLFSVGRFTKDVGPVTFESDGCFAETKGLKWKLGAREGKGLFKLCMTPMMPDEANVASSKDRKGDTTSYLWQLRLGHIGHGGLDAIVKKGYGTGINMTSAKQWELCDGCALGKQTRVSYMKSSPNRAKQVLEVIHSDVCGPMQTSTFSGKRYFVTFTDDKSHFCVVYLLRNKSEVADKFAEFVAMAETQTGKRVKTLRSDNGGEYTSGAMAKFCKDRGIEQKFTPPYTPQLNGVAERMNRTLVECARCMLEHAGLSKSYWGEAVMTATFLRNRCPTRAITHDKSPHQVWTGKKPLLANLKVFGCHAYVHVPKEKRSKFDSKSVRCRFVGYSEHEKAYRFEELESGRVLISRDAQFMEDVFDGGRREYAPKEVLVDLHDEDATDEEVSSGSDRNEDEDEDEAARDEDFEPGSKRHPRTQSLEEAVEVPSAKRQSRHQTLDEMSAAAQESQDFEAAYVVDSVGEMPTTFKSAMESSDATMCEGGCKHDETMANVPYRNAVGCLMYLMVGTRPDLAAAVGVLSQFAADPCPTHWQALKRVFRYIQGTKTHGIEFQGSCEDGLQGYSDADWAGDIESRRSTSGYAFMMNGGCISWRSKKQRTVALSSTEAEYMALSEATQEAVWLKVFLCELGEMANDEAVKIYEDNQGSIALAKNPEFHKRTKHIDIRYHFVREKVEDGQVVLQYVSTTDMLADIMTKPIPATQFGVLRNKLGIQASMAVESSGSVGKMTPRLAAEYR
ncbi:Retrovirus-related Pol polyprotein from transposon TNT 1-94 [Phytophthora cactorum]|nr:Retrovirus-related Pol polyprotein from transposon TNT 1-94 [Phytophthora cactorum]